MNREQWLDILGIAAMAFMPSDQRKSGWTAANMITIAKALLPLGAKGKELIAMYRRRGATPAEIAKMDLENEIDLLEKLGGA